MVSSRLRTVKVQHSPNNSPFPCPYPAVIDGTEHFQGYFEFKKAYYVSGLNKIVAGGHWERRLGTREQARDYCCKADDTHVSGPYSIGEFGASQGKRTDLDAAIETMQDLGWKAMVSQHPTAFVKYYKGLAQLQSEIGAPRASPPEVNIFYGQPGCGKSHSARFGDSEEFWENPLGSGTWFDGYCGQRKAVFDDFDGKMSHWRLGDILRITDCYSLRVAVKGGFVLWNPHIIQLTSNYHPRLWWDWSERELQYPALQRRVTRIYHWRTDSERQDPIIIDRYGTPDLWAQWWRGPAIAGPPPVLGPLDDYVEHHALNPRDAYDFVAGDF